MNNFLTVLPRTRENQLMEASQEEVDTEELYQLIAAKQEKEAEAEAVNGGEVMDVFNTVEEPMETKLRRMNQLRSRLISGRRKY